MGRRRPTSTTRCSRSRADDAHQRGRVRACRSRSSTAIARGPNRSAERPTRTSGTGRISPTRSSTTSRRSAGTRSTSRAEPARSRAGSRRAGRLSSASSSTRAWRGRARRGLRAPRAGRVPIRTRAGHRDLGRSDSASRAVHFVGRAHLPRRATRERRGVGAFARTISDHRCLPPETLATLTDALRAALDRFGETVRVRVVTSTLLARRDG